MKERLYKIVKAILYRRDEEIPFLSCLFVHQVILQCISVWVHTQASSDFVEASSFCRREDSCRDDLSLNVLYYTEISLPDQFDKSFFVLSTKIHSVLLLETWSRSLREYCIWIRSSSSYFSEFIQQNISHSYSVQWVSFVVDPSKNSLSSFRTSVFCSWFCDASLFRLSLQVHFSSFESILFLLYMQFPGIHRE